MEFDENHPSYGNLYLVKRKTLAVLCINYMDFSDTKRFSGTCIDDADISHLEKNAPELDFMEECATVACVLFCPFYDIDDVKGHDGKHLTYFQQFIKDGKLKNKHMQYLSNAQDCRYVQTCILVCFLYIILFLNSIVDIKKKPKSTFGTMVQWYNGTMVRWYNGMMVQ